MDSTQHETMRRLWQTVEPIMDKWLNAGPPEEIDSSLLECDWQEKLPYLDWNDNGSLHFDYDYDGQLCFRIRHDIEVPPEVEKFVTSYLTVDGGQQRERRVLPIGSPPLQDYQRAKHYRRQQAIHKETQLFNALHEAIADPSNPQPIPLSILRKHPPLAAWLNGENPTYAPSMSEYKILWPAFIERRRKLRELQLVASSPTTPTSFVPNEFQREILTALQGRALKVEALAIKVCGGDKSRLYKPGGIKELKDAGLVDKKPRLGYFRPDSPPA